MAEKIIDDAKIYELYQKGMLHREIAKELGYGVSTVTKHLIDMGIRTERINKNKVRELHEAGLTDIEIAERLGCTRSNITVCLNRMGYTDRKSKIDNLELRNRISESLIGRYVGEQNSHYKGYTDEKTIARGIFKTFPSDLLEKTTILVNVARSVAATWKHIILSHSMLSLVSFLKMYMMGILKISISYSCLTRILLMKAIWWSYATTAIGNYIIQMTMN